MAPHNIICLVFYTVFFVLLRSRDFSTIEICGNFCTLFAVDYYSFYKRFGQLTINVNRSQIRLLGIRQLSASMGIGSSHIQIIPPLPRLSFALIFLG